MNSGAFGEPTADPGGTGQPPQPWPQAGIAADGGGQTPPGNQGLPGSGTAPDSQTPPDNQTPPGQWPQPGVPPEAFAPPDLAQYGTDQYGTTQYGTTQYGTGQHGADPYGAGQVAADPYQAGQYGTGPYGGYQPQPFSPGRGRTNPLAIAALVCGLGQFFLGLLIVGNILLAIPALVLGVVGLRQVSMRGEHGRGMAITGIVLGSLGVLYFALVLILIVVGLHTNN